MVSCRFSCKPPMRLIFLSFCLKQHLCTIRHAVKKARPGDESWGVEILDWGKWCGSSLGQGLGWISSVALLEDFYDPCWFLLSLKASRPCKDQDVAQGRCTEFARKLALMWWVGWSVKGSPIIKVIQLTQAKFFWGPNATSAFEAGAGCLWDFRLSQVSGLEANVCVQGMDPQNWKDWKVRDRTW